MPPSRWSHGKRRLVRSLDQFGLELRAIMAWRGDEMILRLFVVVQPVDPSSIDAIDGVNRAHPPIQLASGAVSYLQ
jgi:hypothetical protein